MKGEHIYLLSPIKIDNRLLYPIVSLKVLESHNLFITVDYSVLALKIIEDDLIYFKNINLVEKDYEILKKRLTRGIVN